MLLKSDLNLLNNCRLNLGLPLISTFAGLTDSQVSAIFLGTRNAAITYIIANTGLLPLLPFPEIHPYKGSYPFNTDFCISIIGTYPPISYLLDDVRINPPINRVTLSRGRIISLAQIPFYHGNLNSLWNLLIPIPFAFGTRNMQRVNIINWLILNRINYFDIIDECQRKNKLVKGKLIEYPSSDDSLNNILPNYEGFNQWYKQDCKDSLLIFNTSPTFGRTEFHFSPKKPKINSFEIFIWTALQLNHEVGLSLDGFTWYFILNPAHRIWIRNNMKTKLIFYLKVSDKICTVITGPSPSGGGRRGNTRNSCFLKYQTLLHPNYGNTFDDFRKYIYSNAIKRTFNLLWALNC